MATFKHISSKNADYGAAEQYLTFEHDEFTMKPTLDKNGRKKTGNLFLISCLGVLFYVTAVILFWYMAVHQNEI